MPRFCLTILAYNVIIIKEYLKGKTMLFDIAGALFAIIVFDYYGWLELSSINIAIMLLFSLLTDMDILISLANRKIRGKKTSGLFDNFCHTHRDILHYPLIYIFVGYLVLTITNQDVYVPLFLSLTLFHFLHDSIGIGWGIKWLYPFSEKSYKFFSDKDGAFAWHVASWSPEGQHIAAEKYGDPNWVRNIYFRATPVSVVEYTGFLSSLILFYFYTR